MADRSRDRSRDRAVDPRLYVYRMTLVDWIDGDSAHIDLNWGGREWYRGPSRIAHINAPETNVAATREAGLAARDYAAALLIPGTVRLIVRSAALDKYGRPLLEIEEPAYPGVDWRWFADEMISAGHAVPYDLARQLVDDYWDRKGL